VPAAGALLALAAALAAACFVRAYGVTFLGRARTPGAFELLTPLLDRSSWNEVIRGAVFTGLGELGDPRAVDLMTSWLLDHSKPMDARAAAAGGLGTLARTKLIDPGEAQTQAVNAHLATLDDSWELTQMGAIAALGDWGDARDSRAGRLYQHDRGSHGFAPAGSHPGCNGAAPRGQEPRTLRSDLEQVRG
jgi:HEAT repeat protein